jgi:hypothetical protein
MIRISPADSPSVSSKNVCQELFLCKTVVFLPQLYQSIVQWDPWDYPTILLGGGVYPYIYNIRKKVQV